MFHVDLKNHIKPIKWKSCYFISPSINCRFASVIIACVHFLQAIKCGLTGLWLNIGYFNVNKENNCIS